MVALDWGDRKHVWALRAADWDRVEQGELPNTPEAVEAWAAGLAQRFGGRPVAVALEQARGALLFMLTKYEHLVLFPVHPATLASYRAAFSPSGAKDDPTDACLLLELLVHHRDRLRAWQPDTIVASGSWLLASGFHILILASDRSEERRVGKECRL